MIISKIACNDLSLIKIRHIENDYNTNISFHSIPYDFLDIEKEVSSRYYV